MTVFNFGSINIDHFYRLPHLPGPGETLAATGYDRGLGGKGANQSVAAHRAGADVVHIGMVGPDGSGRRELAGFGVDVRFVGTEGRVTGHANVHVDAAGENMIVVLPGANHEQSLTLLKSALAEARPGDHFMLQGEANLGAEAAALAREAGCFVTYSAAPFKPARVAEMLPLCDLVAVNSVEAQQMAAHLGVTVDALPIANLLITDGAKGARWRGDEVIDQPAFGVEAVDTTGAGDCFIGTVIAALDQGAGRAEALRRGAGAAALQVTRPGTADAMPTADEVAAFLDGR